MKALIIIYDIIFLSIDTCIIVMLHDICLFRDLIILAIILFLLFDILIVYLFHRILNLAAVYSSSTGSKISQASRMCFEKRIFCFQQLHLIALFSSQTSVHILHSCIHIYPSHHTNIFCDNGRETSREILIS